MENKKRKNMVDNNKIENNNEKKKICVNHQECQKKITTNNSSVVTISQNVDAAIMPKAIANLQRQNGCWVPPVVAVAKFYNFSVLKDQTTKVSMESIRELRPGDEPEEFCEVFEDAFGIYPAKKSFSNDADFMERDGNVKCCGPTSIQEYGIWKASKAWIDEVKKSIEQNDAVILLVERLERKDQGKTHYLLVLGCEEKKERRNGKSYILYIKDPTEGNKLLVGKLWDEIGVELMTKQANGSTLDRFNILEATHLSVTCHDDNDGDDGVNSGGV